MKKILVMVAVAMMAAVNVNAQSDEPKHEIGVSYGLGASAVMDAFGPKLTNAIFDSFRHGKTEDETQFGTIAVEYFYHLDNPRLSVGGILAYARYGEDVVDKDSKSKVGERTRNYFTVMPAMKYDWVHKNNFALYSKLGAGVMMLSIKDKDVVNKNSNSDSEVYFMWQASLLGIEVGSQNVRGFVEAGIGEQGIILAGLKYKF